MRISQRALDFGFAALLPNCHRALQWERFSTGSARPLRMLTPLGAQLAGSRSAGVSAGTPTTLAAASVAATFPGTAATPAFPAARAAAASTSFQIARPLRDRDRGSDPSALAPDQGATPMHR
jgi:hypothetical protein